MCQSLTILALRYLNHEFDQHLPQLLALTPGLLAWSCAPACSPAGCWLAWTLPIGGQAALYTLMTLSMVCPLIPVESLPYSSALNAASAACWRGSPVLDETGTQAGYLGGRFGCQGE